MADTLDKLIESETLARVKLLTAVPLVAYGVWIDGVGWLKEEKTQRCFASVQIDVAETAAQLYGAPGRVMPFDESLNTLADVFLKRQQDVIAQRWTVRLKRWMKSWHG